MSNELNNKLSWEKLLSERRRKDMSDSSSAPMGMSGGRVELERDYDRILFAAPTRRLADKTQVFPLEPNDSVRNRLTHSHEVSNLARSMGNLLVYEHGEELFGKSDNDFLKRSIPALLAAIGLAHDIGNPPFGHQGEKAIQSWFRKQKVHGSTKVHTDFLGFNGNAQSFRLLTKLQILNDDYGLNLTCATLTSLMKYPCRSDGNCDHWGGKFCVNESEHAIAKEVWNETGLNEGIRHPLTHIMEACDDIAYSVIDAEDTVKKQYASFNDLVEYLERNTQEDCLTQNVLTVVKEKHKEACLNQLSSNELNDISMQYFRVAAIHEMVAAAIEAFIANLDSILRGDSGELELVKHSKAKKFCEALKQFDFAFGFTNPNVLKLELNGDRIIRETMDFLWEGISGEIMDEKTPFSRYAYRLISENYRRIFEGTTRDTYAQHQLLADAISGMTDGYLVSIHSELKKLSDGSHELRRRNS